MSGQPLSVDAAVAKFVAQVLVEFERVVADVDTLSARLANMGVDEAAANAVTQFLQSRTPDVQALSSAARRFAESLAGSSPDTARLVADVAGVWEGVGRLVSASPPVVPGLGRPPLDVLGALLGEQVDLQLRRLAPLAWSVGAAMGLFGTARSPIDELVAAIDHPLRFALDRLLEYRRELHIEVAGLITGPRTTAWSTAPLGDLPLPAAVAAAVPTGHRIVARLDLALAADTFGDPIHVTLDVVTTADAGFAALLVTVSPLAEERYRLNQHLSVGLAPLDRPMSIALTGFGEVVAIGIDPPQLVVGTTARADLRLGSPHGLRLELGEPVLEATIGASGWRAAAGFGRIEITIPADVVGPVAGALLPRDGIRVRGRLVVAIDDDGVHLDGGVGLEARSPDVLRLPGATVSDLVTTISLGAEGLGFRGAGTIAVRLGPLALTLEGLGARLALAPPAAGRANLGVAHLEAPSVTLPTGFGIRIDAGLIRGGGFLRHDPVRDEYAGALELSLALGPVELSIKAFGVIGSVGRSVSFVAVLSMEFAPPIELFLGLTLNGVGGVFGFNRSIDTGAIGELIRSGRADDLLFPRDPVGRAPVIIDAVNRVFPAKADQVVVGPLLKLGWGRPTSFVTLTVGVLLTFPDPAAVVIIGRLRVALPDESVPIIDLRADFVGVIDFSTGNVSFDASLANSRIGSFTVGGDLALRAGPQGFVFSAGGFHPRFPPPPSVASMRRLSIDVSPPALVKVWAEAYVAVTASSFQFGARAFLVAELGPIDARGSLGFDVLIQTEPRFSFVAEISGDFSLHIGGLDIASARVHVLLEGPGRWHARARASISILFFSVSGSIDLYWGEDDGASLPPPVDPAVLARAALDANATWTATVSPADGAVVSLREGAVGLHPLGSLRLAQTAVPLGVGLQRVGASRVTSTAPVAIATTVVGGRAEPVRDQFAVAQFFDLTDDDRLSRPSFAAYDSGVVVRGDGWTPGSARSAEVVYEESLGERGPRRWLEAAPIEMMSWMSHAAVARARDGATGQHAPRLGHAGALSGATALAGVKVAEVRYVVLDATAGTPVGEAAEWGRLAGLVGRRPVDRLLVAEFEVAP